MPLQNPHVQPERSRVLFTEPQIRAIVGYVASLGNGPTIPTPHPDGRRGGSAALHRPLRRLPPDRRGGRLRTGARVPPLTHATDRQIAEAIRLGPYLMPRFSKHDLSSADVDALISYIDYAKHPDDRGGWSIGRLGPWPEGIVTWLVATAALVVVCLLLGRRVRT